MEGCTAATNAPQSKTAVVKKLNRASLMEHPFPFIKHDCGGALDAQGDIPNFLAA